MKIEFSFDDGHISDLKVVSLLDKYGFKGIFYIPSAQVNRTIQMSAKEIKNGIVLKGHELGGHTVSHPMDLKLVEDKQLKFELENNQLWLESLLGKDVKKFCYPRGRYDDRVIEAVKKAGFTEARTTKVLEIKNDTGNALTMPTTIHLFQRAEYEGLDWLIVAKQYFQKALKASETDQNVFYHCWGHSAELDRYNDWERFEELLKYISEQLVIHNGANGASSL